MDQPRHHVYSRKNWRSITYEFCRRRSVTSISHLFWTCSFGYQSFSSIIDLSFSVIEEKLCKYSGMEPQPRCTAYCNLICGSTQPTQLSSFKIGLFIRYDVNPSLKVFLHNHISNRLHSFSTEIVFKLSSSSSLRFSPTFLSNYFYDSKKHDIKLLHCEMFSMLA